MAKSYVQKTVSLFFGIGLLLGLPLNATDVIQQQDTLVLAEDGPYEVGFHRFMFTDENRNDRELSVGLWYPAIAPENAGRQSDLGWVDAHPFTDEAPYPLILYSHWATGTYLSDLPIITHLTTYGFAVASIGHDCDAEPTCVIDRPLDVLFVLDALAQLEDTPLIGVIDTDHTGVMGISYGGYTALSVSGASIDPDFVLEWYADKPIIRALGWRMTDVWAEVTAYREHFDDLIPGERWPAFTDERIQAVMPAVPALLPLYGEHGLATINVPMLTLASLGDESVDYETEIAPFFAETNDDNILISLTGYGHHPEWRTSGEAYYQHFSVAFFGLHLQQQEDYTAYLTESFVTTFDNLDWGVIETE